MAITTNGGQPTANLTLSSELSAAITDESGTGALVFNTSPTLITPTLGTPASGTLTNATGLPVSGITASTSAALGVGSVELGHATDTTLARASAGVVTIEGVNVVTTSSTDTLTNKTLTSPTVDTQASFSNQAETRFLEATANGTNYVGFKAPASIASNLVWTLPSADGTVNQVLSTDGSGVLSFATASSGGVSANDQAFAFAVQVFA
jgi:hypothetical protein